MPDEPRHDTGDEDDVVDARLRDRAADGGPVRAAKRRYGVAGAMLAGAMVALRDLLEKPKDDQAVVVDAPSEPTDMDHQGITVEVAPGLAAHSPARMRPPSDPAAAREWTERELRRRRG